MKFLLNPPGFSTSSNRAYHVRKHAELHEGQTSECKGHRVVGKLYENKLNGETNTDTTQGWPITLTVTPDSMAGTSRSSVPVSILLSSRVPPSSALDRERGEMREEGEELEREERSVT